MKIAQITDLHIGHDGQETYNVDVRDNFLIILGEVVFEQPDLIVLTGDLCFEHGEISIYTWIKERLDNTEIPYLVLPGNHDDPKMMMQVFEIDYSHGDEELYFAKKLNKTTALFLDNSKAQHSENQKKWLKRQLHQADKNLVVFTHYPPVKCQVEFMDKNHCLQDSEDIQNLFSAFEKNIYLFCGHYHIEKTIHLDNLHVFITPSTYLQINPKGEDFAVETYQIGYRLIDLSKSSCMSRVKYVEGKKMI